MMQWPLQRHFSSLISLLVGWLLLLCRFCVQARAPVLLPLFK